MQAFEPRKYEPPTDSDEISAKFVGWNCVRKKSSGKVKII
jgi:hypothetical protein